MPPLAFETLVAELLPEGELREVIDELRERKRKGESLNLAPPIPILTEFVTGQMERLSVDVQAAESTLSWEPLDALFRTLLAETRA